MLFHCDQAKWHWYRGIECGSGVHMRDKNNHSIFYGDNNIRNVQCACYINIHHCSIIYWPNDEYCIRFGKITSNLLSFFFIASSPAAVVSLFKNVYKSKKNRTFFTQCMFICRARLYWMRRIQCLTATTWTCVSVLLIHLNGRLSYVHWIAFTIVQQSDCMLPKMLLLAVRS